MAEDDKARAKPLASEAVCRASCQECTTGTPHFRGNLDHRDYRLPDGPHSIRFEMGHLGGGRRTWSTYDSKGKLLLHVQDGEVVRDTHLIHDSELLDGLLQAVAHGLAVIVT